jgi:nitrogenase molybdenum-iron protein NifN
MPPVVHVSTPSYNGTHADGFHGTVRALVEQLAQAGPRGEHINVFPPMVSPADLRYLKEILVDFGLSSMVLPDYSETLDAPTWEDYQLIPHGGSSLDAIRAAGQARLSIEFSDTNDAKATAGAFLAEQHAVPNRRLGMPIGVARSDELFAVLKQVTGRPMPEKHALERGRLIDSLVDGHKYVFDKRAVVYGEEDLVAGIAALLVEIGMVPVLCASGGESGRLERALAGMNHELGHRIEVRQGVDFAELEDLIASVQPDLLIGNSKGYSLARKFGLPLVRVGFPIHDRVGGARLLHIGYRGAQQLVDQITNTLIAAAQDESEVGYAYM